MGKDVGKDAMRHYRNMMTLYQNNLFQEMQDQHKEYNMGSPNNVIGKGKKKTLARMTPIAQEWLDAFSNTENTKRRFETEESLRQQKFAADMYAAANAKDFGARFTKVDHTSLVPTGYQIDEKGMVTGMFEAIKNPSSVLGMLGIDETIPEPDYKQQMIDRGHSMVFKFDTFFRSAFLTEHGHALYNTFNSSGLRQRLLKGEKLTSEEIDALSRFERFIDKTTSKKSDAFVTAVNEAQL